MFLKLAYLFIFIILTGSSIAQKTLYYDQFTSDKGLSENVVYCVLQDKRGFIWAGTHHGLNRYDGYSFKKYYAKTDDSTSLSQNDIYSIIEDPNGRLWLSTGNGLDCFDPVTNKTKRVTLSNYGLKGTNAIKILSGDSILLLSSNKVYLFLEKQNKCTPVAFPNQEVNTEIFFDLPNETVGIWNQPSKSLLIYNNSKNQFESANKIPGSDLILPPHPDNYFHDNKGNHFIVANSESIEIYNNEGKLLIRVDNQLYPEVGRIHYSSFTDDTQGNVWIATSAGLFLYQQQTKKFSKVELMGDSRSLKGNKEIRAACIDKDQNLWLGSFGEGLLKCSIRPVPFNSISLELLTPKNVQRMIFGLHQWPGGFIVAETGFSNFTLIKENKVVRFVDSKTLGVEQIVEITTSKKLNQLTSVQQQITKIMFANNVLNPHQFILHDSNTILKSTPDYYAYKLDTGFQILNTYTTNTYDDGKYYWAATTNGLLRVDKKDLSHYTYLHIKNDSTSLNENYLYHLWADENNNLWIGSKGGGLNFFDQKQNRFYHYTTNEGLPDNVIYTILPDHKGNLWLSTNNGLSRFNLKTKTFTNFSRRDGLLNSEFNRNGGLMTKDGTLYFSGTNGIDYFNPNDLVTVKTSPVVLISGIEVNGASASLYVNSTLKHFQNNITFSFTANDFTRPDLVYYRYKLKDKDEWTRVQGKNAVTYNSLANGTYKFTVQSSYDNYNWSESTVQVFSIDTPWWKTTWFYGIVFAAISLVLFLFYRYRIDQLKKIMAMRTKISRDLHDEVGATLSSIQVYSAVANKAMSKEPEKATDALHHIFENTTQAMENMSDIVWAINTHQSGNVSLSGKLKNYGYEILTPRNISCSYHINSEAEKKLVNIEARRNILLIAKEAMNNAAKHSAATEMTIELSTSNTHLHLQVTDNGKGISQSNNIKGNGLENMKKRTEELGGSFHITTEEQKGTSLRCSIPLTNISD